MAEQKSVGINIKGIRDGLLIQLAGRPADESYEQLTAALAAEIAARADFLRGSRIALDVGRRTLNSAELAGWQTLLADHNLTLWTILGDAETTREAARQIGLATRLPGSPVGLEGESRVERQTNQVAPEKESVEPAAGKSGLLLRETIRSGRSIYHEGHITIIGDVNPGAEIIAGGDIVVWGKLRGMVHAGALGDNSAVICALGLIPTQLRIGEQIAISPDEQRRKLGPEMAFVHRGRIIAEPWPVRE